MHRPSRTPGLGRDRLGTAVFDFGVRNWISSAMSSSSQRETPSRTSPATSAESNTDVEEPAFGRCSAAISLRPRQAMMLWTRNSSVPLLTIRKDATAVPLGVYRSFGSAVRRPIRETRLRDGPRRRGAGGVSVVAAVAAAGAVSVVAVG